MTLQGELSWEEAACFTLQRSEKLFSSADEILQSIVANNLKNNCAGVDRRALEAILLCFSRGSSCKLVASSRKLNGHSRETLRFALKEEMDSHMFHFVDVDLTDAELELIKLNGLLSEETLQREKTRKSLCVIRAPYSSQHLEKKVPTKTKSSSTALQNGHVKPPVVKPLKQSTASGGEKAAEKPEKSTISPNNSSKHFHFLQSPNSPLVTANLKNLVNETVFDELPLHIQDELLSNLPDCDDSVSALLNNEFFSSALETFRNHLADGLFQSTEFCEKVIAPDRLPPPKMSYSLINEEEHYNITAVSPTKIRIAKSYSGENTTKQTRNRDGVTSGAGTNRLGANHHKKQSSSRVQLQNERVTALKKSTRARRHNAETKSGHGNNIPPQIVGNDTRIHNLPKATRPIVSPLKTKSSQQAILHNLQTRHLMTHDAKVKRPPNTPGGKPSVRFLEPTQSAPVRPVNPAALAVPPPDTKSLPLTKTLASAKVFRKRKVSSFSMNNMWIPATTVHTEWIEMSDDDLEYPSLVSTAVPLSVTTTDIINNDQFSLTTSKRCESGSSEVETYECVSAAMPGKANGQILDDVSVSRVTNEALMRESLCSPRQAQTVVEKIATGKPDGSISSLSCSSSDKQRTSNGHLTNGQTNGFFLACSFLEPKDSSSLSLYENGSDVFSDGLNDEKKEMSIGPLESSSESAKAENLIENGTCSPDTNGVHDDSGGGIASLTKSGNENDYATLSNKSNLSKSPKILDNVAVNSSLNIIPVADLVDVNCTEVSKSISSSISMPSSSSSKLKPKSPSLTSTATISNGNSSLMESESAMSQSISSTTVTIANNNNNNRESPPDPLLSPSVEIQRDVDTACVSSASAQNCGSNFSPTATTSISCPATVSELDKLLFSTASSPLPSSLADVPSGGPELLLTSVPTPVAVPSSGSQKSSNFANN